MEVTIWMKGETRISERSRGKDNLYMGSDMPPSHELSWTRQAERQTGEGQLPRMAVGCRKIHLV